MRTPDPFGTADLRRVVLDAWAASPARFREDANAEDLLASGGYAGRALVELAANGVDAARESGVPARLRLRLTTAELRLANTGAPLSAAGAAALASLRASAKRHATESVGFFGVGFTAVLSWSSSPRVVSTTGGVRFDADATRTELMALDRPELEHELDLRDAHVPVLRLPWPTGGAEDPVPVGYTTEVRLPLTAAADAEVGALLADPDTVEDLLWALPDLVEIDLPDRVVRRHTDADGSVVIDDGGRTRTYRVVTRSGEVPPELLSGRPVEQRGRNRWHLTWVLPAESADRGFTVGAPTPTDEPLTLPARLVGTLPVDDTRRRLAAGPLRDHLLDRAADAYLELVQAAAPEQRWRLLPVTGFPAGPVDAALRSGIAGRARGAPLFPTAMGDWVAAPESCLLPGVDGDGAALIGQAVPGLLAPIPRAAVAVLRELGMVTLTWSQVSSAMAGIERPPGFWRELYRAAATAEPRPQPEDLADIPVPLAGGRRTLGARGCLLPTGGTSGAERIDDPGGIDDQLARRIGELVPDLRVVHPDAAHPLLLRLGARPAEPAAVLVDPALTDRVGGLRRDLEDTDVDPDEARDVASVVLDLLARADPDGASTDPAIQQLLDDLVLTDVDGNPWPATELLLPDAALARVLAPDVDRVTVGAEWLGRYGSELLVRAGVRDGFPVITVADPANAHDRLPDLLDWADRTAPAPDEPLRTLADLDLVDGQRWPAALALIAGDRRARDCLAPTAAGPSYGAWWLARNALLRGAPPGAWRLASATDLAGLYETLPLDLDPTVARWIGVRGDLARAASDDPGGLLDRLADPDRRIAAARVPSVTAAVVAALDAVPVEPDLPSGVRTLSGDVADADTALVLDEPWWLQVVPAGRLVPGGPDPAAVGRVLDLPLVSVALGPAAVTTRDSVGAGAAERWARAAAAVDLDPATVDLSLAGTIEVRADGPTRAVVWWAADGHYYSTGTAESLGRVAAWTAGRWAARHRAVAAAEDDLTTLAEDGVG